MIWCCRSGFGSGRIGPRTAGAPLGLLLSRRFTGIRRIARQRKRRWQAIHLDPLDGFRFDNTTRTATAARRFLGCDNRLRRGLDSGDRLVGLRRRFVARLAIFALLPRGTLLTETPILALAPVLALAARFAILARRTIFAGTTIVAGLAWGTLVAAVAEVALAGLARLAIIVAVARGAHRFAVALVIAIVAVVETVAALLLLFEARAIFSQHAEIMVRELEIIFGHDPVALGLGIARQRLVFLEQLGGIATRAIINPVAVLAVATLPGRATAPTAAAVLTIVDQRFAAFVTGGRSIATPNPGPSRTLRIPVPEMCEKAGAMP
ncbi:hypothetical protein ACFB49_41570 [Sphingomonas sp. DBB INV C78]